jgi:hypothetical protein
MKILAACCAFFLIVLNLTAPASADDSSEIEELREQIRLLSERLDQLERVGLAEAAPDATKEAPAPATSVRSASTPQAQQHAAMPGHSSLPATPDEQELDRQIDQAVDEKLEQRMAAVSWAERLRWSGDFRYRYENIAEEGTDDRNRNRIRARANLEADVSDTVKIGFGLATGGEDPVSTNQTIGGGGSSKPISLDLAYFEWTGLSHTTVVGGKFKQQHHSAGDFSLLWDSDWRPEGTSIRYDNGMLYAVGLGTWIESDSNMSQQEFSYGLQTGIKLPLGASLGLNLGAGYFRFDSRGKGAFFGDNDFFGNSFDPVDNSYLYDYHEVEGFAELGFALFDRPIVLFADYVQNLEADENNTGYALGINYNDARKKGTWELNYAYKKLEADAVLGLLADSDFGGGGTNVKGSVISGAYAIHDNWNFQMTYFVNQTSIDSTDPRDFDRLMLDLQFKYK